MRSCGHRKVTTQPTKENKDEAKQETPKQCPRTEQHSQACVFECVCASVCAGFGRSSSRISLPHSSWDISGNHWGPSLYRFSTIQWSLPSENSNLQKYSVCPQFPSLITSALLTFPILFPVHITPDDGTSEGLWTLFAGIQFYLFETKICVSNRILMLLRTIINTAHFNALALLCGALIWTWAELSQIAQCRFALTRSDYHFFFYLFFFVFDYILMANCK